MERGLCSDQMLLTHVCPEWTASVLARMDPQLLRLEHEAVAMNDYGRGFEAGMWHCVDVGLVSGGSLTSAVHAVTNAFHRGFCQ